MKRPNIIFIMTDTQGINMIESYNGQRLQTPNIDKLAADGVTFQNAYTTCPLCTPARASLFTGTYSHTSGPWTNNIALGNNMITMGQRFSNQGYQTPYIGKWHLDGHDYFGTGKPAVGWEPNYWYDGINYLNELNEKEISLWRNGLNSAEDLRKNNITKEFTWANRISNRAIDFLDRRDKEKPFLLVCSYDEPHHPFTCPPEYVEKFEDFYYNLGEAGHDDLSNKPEHQRQWAAAQPSPAKDGIYHHPLYFGCNHYVDAEIGRIIDKVDELKLENTYIIFTSDHGEMMGAHQLVGKGAAMYEEITHIPLIVRNPEKERAGFVDHSIVSHIDLLPTLLDIAGFKQDEILEGESIKPLIKGEKQNIERSVVIEFNRYEIEHDSFGGFKPIRAYRKGDYKLVINLLSSDELYDLKNDPYEVNNLIESPRHTEIRDKLHSELIEWMYEKRDPFRAAEWEARPWRKDRTLGWMGAFRPRPRDGYAPTVRDYDTGLPTKGVKMEEKKTNF